MSNYYRVDLEATGVRIKLRMYECGITLEDVANMLNLGSTTAVKGWRRGDYAPTLAHAIILARILNTTVEELIVVVHDQ